MPESTKTKNKMHTFKEGDRAILVSCDGRERMHDVTIYGVGRKYFKVGPMQNGCTHYDKKTLENNYNCGFNHYKLWPSLEAYEAYKAEAEEAKTLANALRTSISCMSLEQLKKLKEFISNNVCE